MDKDDINININDYKEFMSLQDVADYLGVHINSIYNYLKDGGKPLPSIHISKKKILVKKEDLIDWLNEQKDEEENE